MKPVKSASTPAFRAKRSKTSSAPSSAEHSVPRIGEKVGPEEVLNILRQGNAITIGTYGLGYRPVDLKVRASTKDDATSNFVLDSRKNSTIELCLRKSWGSTVSTLLHEAWELSALDMGVTYLPECFPGICPSQGRVFMFDHQKHAEIAARVGEFVAESMKEVEKYWQMATKADILGQ